MDHHLLETGLRTLAVGAGATAAMDAWRFLLQKTLGVNSLDLGLLGRWVGHAVHGRMAHNVISKSAPVRGELPLGWITHYAIGIGFSALLPLLWGAEWLHFPTLLPAMTVGLGTILAPWFLMQPAMGLGVAASRTASPNRVRLRNVAIHLVYGVGLYGSALLLARLCPVVP